MVGEECVVSWDAPPGCYVQHYNLYYTVDDAETWGIITEGCLGTDYTWTVPDEASAMCRVLVEAYDPDGIMGYNLSDEVFSILPGAGAREGESAPVCPVLHEAEPNPFIGSTLIRFDLPVADYVTLNVHDIRGRLVSQITDESRPAGSHSVPWDGSDDYGKTLPGGIYFVRMQAGTYASTAKVVLAR